MQLPAVLDPALVGTYPASVKSGGGYVWDEVLEYRVWCHPEQGAPDVEDGSDYNYAFVTFEEAAEFTAQTPGADAPLALVLQREYIGLPGFADLAQVRAGEDRQAFDAAGFA